MIERKQVEEAVSAMLKLLEGPGIVKLVDQPQKIDVQFTLKQIPNLKNKAINIDLPNSIHYESREVCLFVKDLDKKNREYEGTVEHYEDLLKKEKVDSISKIVPLKALRTDYSLPTSKVSLAKAYDLFVADPAVMGLLPGLLGKIFYSKKKTIPVKLNLGARPLKHEVDRVLNNTRCILQGTGSTCLVTVAHDRLKMSEIVSNILAACTQLAEKLPGGQENIRNIYIKGTDTTAVPVYMDLGSANNVKLPELKPTPILSSTDDISTVLGGKLMVRADGIVQYIKDPEVKKEKLEGEASSDDTDDDSVTDEETDFDSEEEDAEETMQESGKTSNKRKSRQETENTECVSSKKKKKQEAKEKEKHNTPDKSHPKVDSKTIKKDSMKGKNKIRGGHLNKMGKKMAKDSKTGGRKAKKSN